MSSGVSLARPTTLPENVKDIPVIKQGPSISKVLPEAQGNWMDSTAMRTAAIFYVIVSVLWMFRSTMITPHKNHKNFQILVMGALFINMCFSFKLAQHVYSFGSH